MHGLYYLVLQPLIGGEGPAGRDCVLGSIGCARTGGADIAAYKGGMQDGGGGAASQARGLVWLLGALGGRASVRGQEASGRGEARPRRSPEGCSGACRRRVSGTD